LPFLPLFLLIKKERKGGGEEIRAKAEKKGRGVKELKEGEKRGERERKSKGEK